jgi:hypothetical protein
MLQEKKQNTCSKLLFIISCAAEYRGRERGGRVVRGRDKYLK